MSSQTEFIVKGATDVTVDVMLVQDNSGTNPGDPITGLAYDSTNLVCYYREGGTGTLTQLTLATLASATATHADGGFVEVSSTNAPGLYRLDLSDTIVSGSNNKATVVLSGYADLAPHFINIVLLDFNIQSATPNVNVSTMSASSVTATAIADNALTAAKIATAAIDADALAADCITAAKIADNALTSDQLDATFVTEIWNKVCETQGSYTAQQILSIALAVLAGETNTNGTVFNTPNDAATRVSSTLDASNNRTAMTLTPSS